MDASTCTFLALTFLVSLTVGYAQPTSGSFSGVATFSPGAGDGGWACDGQSGPAPGLGQVAINGAQFGGGSACGACIQVTGTGEGQGSTPLTGTMRVTVVNVFGAGSPGDLDILQGGDGQWGINWSFVPCPGGSQAGRKLLSI